MEIPQIHPKAVQEKIEQGERIFLIDVRTKEEFGCSHAPNAINIPLQELRPDSVDGKCDGRLNGTLYFICRSGARARQACEKMAAAGFENMVIVEGGMVGWEREGLPVTVNKAVMPIEHQVRITIGSFVLLGALLAFFAHPAFAFIPAFMGMGMVQAGITGRCPLATLVAKMPWNKAQASSCCVARS